MSNKQVKTLTMDEIAEMAIRGEDISEHFGEPVLKEPIAGALRKEKKGIQTVNIEFPVAFLREIDDYADSLNVPRASVIKMLLRDALDSKLRNKRLHAAVFEPSRRGAKAKEFGVEGYEPAAGLKKSVKIGR